MCSFLSFIRDGSSIPVHRLLSHIMNAVPWSWTPTSEVRSRAAHTTATIREHALSSVATVKHSSSDSSSSEDDDENNDHDDPLVVASPPRSC
jgi:hypothetical protein